MKDERVEAVAEWLAVWVDGAASWRECVKGALEVLALADEAANVVVLPCVMVHGDGAVEIDGVRWTGATVIPVGWPDHVVDARATVSGGRLVFLEPLCSACHGAGCGACNGAGKVPYTRRIRANVAPFVAPQGEPDTASDTGDDEDLTGQCEGCVTPFDTPQGETLCRGCTRSRGTPQRPDHFNPGVDVALPPPASLWRCKRCGGLDRCVWTVGDVCRACGWHEGLSLDPLEDPAPPWPANGYPGPECEGCTVDDEGICMFCTRNAHPEPGEHLYDHFTTEAEGEGEEGRPRRKAKGAPPKASVERPEHICPFCGSTEWGWSDPVRLACGACDRRYPATPVIRGFDGDYGLHPDRSLALEMIDRGLFRPEAFGPVTREMIAGWVERDKLEREAARRAASQLNALYSKELAALAGGGLDPVDVLRGDDEKGADDGAE